MIRTTLGLLAAGLLLVGCAGGDGGADADASGEEASAAAMTDDHAGHDHGDDAPGEMAATPVTLTGTMGCGHCTFKKGTSCSSAIETADGTIYLLEGADVGQGSELFDKRMDGLTVTVTGTPMEKDGETVVTVTSHEVM